VSSSDVVDVVGGGAAGVGAAGVGAAAVWVGGLAAAGVVVVVCAGGGVLGGCDEGGCVDGEVDGGFGVCVGPGAGVGAGWGVCVGVDSADAEIKPAGALRADRPTERLATGCAPAERVGCTRCPGGMRTTGEGGAGSMMRGLAATRTSSGALDSNAARQRYPDVTPAATSRQSRSASNEIPTRIIIGLLPDSIGANIEVC
jgi:hypothetical protein